MISHNGELLLTERIDTRRKKSNCPFQSAAWITFDLTVLAIFIIFLG